MRSLLWICIGSSALFLFYVLLSTNVASFDFKYFKELVPESPTRPSNSVNRSSVLNTNSDSISHSPSIDEEALFASCVLPEFDEDGWTNEIIENSVIDSDPTKKCDKDFMTFTVLGSNGTVWLNPNKKGMDKVNCQARALYLKDDLNYNASRWISLESNASTFVFDSDFVHTTCKNESAEIVEDFVHFQMWNAADDKEGEKSKSGSFGYFPTFFQPSILEKEEGIDEKPSVFIFVFDSVANSQALRSLPKTISLLKHEFGAVNLKHVTKVGENSSPNGMAFLFGKLTSNMDRGIFGMGRESADWNETYACLRYLDDDPFILKEFSKKGYKSLMAEDWKNGVFNYPNCWGFKNAPVTHYMRPFQAYYEEDITKSRKFMGDDQCLEYHTFLYNYLSKFIDAYPKSPKISMLWASNVAHDTVDGLFHVDVQLFNYFRQHRKVLDKSYVFLMGDHGIRWGQVRETWLGEREINNPMMFVSVPRKLREKINPVLKENSNKLLTSFDIYSSLIDILNEPHLEAPSGPRELRGNSFFRQLPAGERSCRTLPIPIQFCPCEWNKTKSEDKTRNEEIGAGTVRLLNGKLEEYQIAGSCEQFTLKETKDVKMIDRTDGLTEIIFSAVECEAEFQTIVRVRQQDNGGMNISLAASDFTRRNSYGDTAACMNSQTPSLRPICCCRYWIAFVIDFNIAHVYQG